MKIKLLVEIYPKNRNPSKWLFIFVAILFGWGLWLGLGTTLRSAGKLIVSMNPSQAVQRANKIQMSNGIIPPVIDTTIVDNRAYASRGLNGMSIIDITDPLNPIVESYLQTGASLYTIQVIPPYAYIACNGGGTDCTFQIIDVSDPFNPILVTTYGTDSSTSDIQIVGTLAYVATFLGIDIVDITDIRHPNLLAHYVPPDYPVYRRVFNLVVHDSIIYATFRDNLSVGNNLGGSLALIAATYPTTPTIISSIETGAAYGIQIHNQLAYITYREPSSIWGGGPYRGGFRVIDVSNPVSPTIITTFSELELPYTVQITGSLAYIANGYSGVTVLDISQSMTPAWYLTYPTEAYASTAQVANSFLYVAANQSGLEIYPIITGPLARNFIPVVPK